MLEKFLDLVVTGTIAGVVAAVMLFMMVTSAQGQDLPAYNCGPFTMVIADEMIVACDATGQSDECNVYTPFTTGKGMNIWRALVKLDDDPGSMDARLRYRLLDDGNAFVEFGIAYVPVNGEAEYLGGAEYTCTPEEAT